MMTDMQKQSIRTMRQTGLSYGAIADAADLSINTIKSFCRRENVDVTVNGNNGKHQICSYCGRPLQHSPGKKKKRFCSDKCRYDWWNHNRRWVYRKKAYHLICHGCGAEFESYGNRNRKYCGRECYFRSRYGEGLP